MEEEEYIKQLGAKIKSLRLEKNMSQIELANRCDFEKGNMNRIEAGRTSPTLKTLLKISKALDIPIKELMI